MITGSPAVALGAWLLTAGIGAYMLRTWIARGGLRRQRATGAGVPPAVLFGHAGTALAGLAVWISFVGTGWEPLAWAGVLLAAAVITLGICMVTLWTPYPVRPGPEPEKEPMAVRVAELPGAFTVTDEMITRLLTEPAAVRRRRSLHLLPLIPACHGFAALATFGLAVVAAVSAR